MLDRDVGGGGRRRRNGKRFLGRCAQERRHLGGRRDHPGRGREGRRLELGGSERRRAVGLVLDRVGCGDERKSRRRLDLNRHRRVVVELHSADGVGGQRHVGRHADHRHAEHANAVVDRDLAPEGEGAERVLGVDEEQVALEAKGTPTGDEGARLDARQVDDEPGVLGVEALEDEALVGDDAAIEPLIAGRRLEVARRKGRRKRRLGGSLEPALLGRTERLYLVVKREARRKDGHRLVDRAHHHARDGRLLRSCVGEGRADEDDLRGVLERDQIIRDENAPLARVVAMNLGARQCRRRIDRRARARLESIAGLGDHRTDEAARSIAPEDRPDRERAGAAPRRIGQRPRADADLGELLPLAHSDKIRAARAPAKRNAIAGAARVAVAPLPRYCDPA